MMKLVGQPFNISISYTVAENYPVDLYYLMDMSHSMLKHKQVLAQIAETLVETSKNSFYNSPVLNKKSDQFLFQVNSLTSDFRLGFGSFVDKNGIFLFYCLTRSNYIFRNHQLLNLPYPLLLYK